MASKKHLKALTEELRKRHIPQGTIWELDSLSDNFIFSLLKGYAPIEGFSIIELSEYLKKHNLVNDFDVLELIVEQNNINKEVQDGK